MLLSLWLPKLAQLFIKKILDVISQDWYFINLSFRVIFSPQVAYTVTFARVARQKLMELIVKVIGELPSLCCAVIGPDWGGLCCLNMCDYGLQNSIAHPYLVASYLWATWVPLSSLLSVSQHLHIRTQWKKWNVDLTPALQKFYSLFPFVH